VNADLRAADLLRYLADEVERLTSERDDLLAKWPFTKEFAALSDRAVKAEAQVQAVRALADGIEDRLDVMPAEWEPNPGDWIYINAVPVPEILAVLDTGSDQ